MSNVRYNPPGENRPELTEADWLANMMGAVETSATEIYESFMQADRKKLSPAAQVVFDKVLKVKNLLDELEMEIDGMIVTDETPEA